MDEATRMGGASDDIGDVSWNVPTITLSCALPQVVADAWSHFTDVQTKTVKHRPFFAATDKPPIRLNESIMAKYRPEMRTYYYASKKYGSHLEQLGITYPTVRKIVQSRRDERGRGDMAPAALVRWPGARPGVASMSNRSWKSAS